MKTDEIKNLKTDEMNGNDKNKLDDIERINNYQPITKKLMFII